MDNREDSDLNYYRKLAHKLLTGDITENELQELEVWYNAGQEDPVHIPASFSSDEEAHEKRLLQNIREKIGWKDAAKRPWIPLFAGNTRWVAAAMIAVIFTSVYFFLNRSEKYKTATLPASTVAVDDLAPGGNKAMLTLADGTRIELDSVGNGTVFNEGGIAIVKSENGNLSYSKEEGSGQETLYNTINIPRGGQYQLSLQDGTKVWLNAGSSLTFPVSFHHAGRREVILEGEGYFEVVTDQTKPFYVQVGSMEVKVTGTHFNIKAYADESEIETTLIEGKVVVKNKGDEMILNPGQQAGLNLKTLSLKKHTTVDLTRVMAWKNGEFVFDDTELKEAMRTLSRWYDFEVFYERSVQPAYLYGAISREKSLNSVLKMMEELGVQFRIEKVSGVNRVTVF